MPIRSVSNIAAVLAVSVITAMASVLPACASLSEGVAAPSAGRTEVGVFMPAVPNAPQREGYCWTESIAAPRAGAWRCMIGNSIEDPCFSVADFSDAVVCGANPADSAPGFLMRLSKPLPATSGKLPPPPTPWIVQLAIGQGPQAGPFAMPPHKTFCSMLTGTMPMVDGEAVPYLCWEAKVESEPKLGATQIGLLGDFKPGRVWTVTEVTFVANPVRGPNQPPFKRTDMKTVALEKVWE